MNSPERIISPTFSHPEAGMSKIWIVVIALLVVGGIFGSATYIPIYGKKGKIEERLESSMFKLDMLGEDLMFEQLQAWFDQEKIAIDAYEDCVFEGELGQPGVFYCDYVETVKYPGYTHTMKMRAYRKLSKIPYQ